MSNYGLKVNNATGNTVVDITDRLTRLRYAREVAAGASGSVLLADTSGAQSVELSFIIERKVQSLAHNVNRSGNSLVWTARQSPSYLSRNCLIFQFLYT